MAYVDEQCDALGRPRNEVLRTLYNFPVLRANQAEADAKLREIMAPEVIERRGDSGLLTVGTAEKAIAHYRAMVAQGIQYFTVNLGDTADRETLRILAEDVMPAVRG